MTTVQALMQLLSDFQNCCSDTAKNVIILHLLYQAVLLLGGCYERRLDSARAGGDIGVDADASG